MSIKKTYFVHGTTIDNIEKLSTGWLDGKLSEKGIKQSIDLKEQVDINQFDVVFCSDLKRAIDSANLTFSGIKDIIIDKNLRECNYGDYNSKKSSFVNYETHINTKFPNGECLKDVENRIRDFIEYLKKNYDNKHIAIVAHKAPQFAFDVILNHNTWENAIEQDWRKTKSWQPGWEYIIE